MKKTILLLLSLLVGCNIINSNKKINDAEEVLFKIKNDKLISILEDYYVEMHLNYNNIITINYYNYQDSTIYDIYGVCNQTDISHEALIISKVEDIYVYFYMGLENIIENEKHLFLFENTKSILLDNGIGEQINDSMWVFVPGITYDFDIWRVIEKNGELKIASKRTICNTDGLFHD